jgi:hypothetical protein
MPCATGLLGACAEGKVVCDPDISCIQNVMPSVELCGTPEDESCDGLGCTGAPLWSRRFGDGAEQLSQAVGTDSQGNVIVTGVMWGAVDFGGEPLVSAGEADMFVAKLDPSGAQVWSRRFGATSWQGALAGAVDGDGNIVIAGAMNGTVLMGEAVLVAAPANGGDMFVAKLSPAGEVLWAKSASAPGEQQLFGLTTDGAKNVLAVGAICGAAGFGQVVGAFGGGCDAHLVKLDKNGTFQWDRTYGGFQYQGAWGISTDAGGNVYFAGATVGPVDFGGGPVPYGGGADGFLVKLGPDGVYQWGKSFGDMKEQSGIRTAVDRDGNLLFSFQFDGTVNFGGDDLTSQASPGDCGIAKFGPDGKHLWSKRLHNTGSKLRDFHVATDAAGNVLIAGMSDGSVDFGGGKLTAEGDDLFVAKLDPDGNHVWSERYGGPGATLRPYSAAAGALGDLVVAGALGGAVDFGSGPLVSAGSTDAFVVRFSP